MSGPANADFFDPVFLARVAEAASHDAFVARHSTLADLRIGFQETGSKRQVWLSVVGGQVKCGTGDGGASFRFVGGFDAFTNLAKGFPFNRLVRQHRLSVEGDLRACVNEWLLIYAVTRVCGMVER